MGRTPLSINDHGLAHKDAREAPNCSPIALPQLRRRTCSLGKGKTNEGPCGDAGHWEGWNEQAPT